RSSRGGPTAPTPVSRDRAALQGLRCLDAVEADLRFADTENVACDGFGAPLYGLAEKTRRARSAGKLGHSLPGEPATAEHGHRRNRERRRQTCSSGAGQRK